MSGNNPLWPENNLTLSLIMVFFSFFFSRTLISVLPAFISRQKVVHLLHTSDTSVPSYNNANQNDTVISILSTTV